MRQGSVGGRKDEVSPKKRRYNTKELTRADDLGALPDLWEVALVRLERWALGERQSS
jgi:hypothetical protein